MKLSVRKKPALITSLAAALTLFISAKVHQYAAGPAKAKDCRFIFPKTADQTNPTVISLQAPEQALNFKQRGGVANDASCLNATAVYGVVKISSADDVRNALQFARANNLKVTSAGQQHSMGGQSFVQNGLMMDMKSFNRMKLDKERKILNVESGARWVDVQQFLDREGLAVKAMQSINIFTVGGTLSVNAHGIAHDPGPIAPTVRSMRVMASDGTVATASPDQNAGLFRSVLGGYGLFGVILDVDLDVVDNEMYRWTRDFMDYHDFPAYYRRSIENNKDIGLLYGRLSMSPTSYLKETIIHKYEKINEAGTPPALQLPQHTWINRLVINFSKTGGIGRWVRWMLEKHAEPRLHLCSRNQAMSQTEVCLVSRNQEMYDAMGYLKNRLQDTDILQEYFIPHEKMPEFVDGLRKTVQNNGANLLNVTIRIVSKDEITSLPYAKKNMFAFVLYFNQKLNEKESRVLQKTTADLIDVATGLDGTYYLPYQLFYTPEQLRKAYPEVDAFFAAKKKYDPSELFMNKWYEKYSPAG